MCRTRTYVYYVHKHALSANHRVENVNQILFTNLKGIWQTYCVDTVMYYYYLSVIFNIVCQWFPFKVVDYILILAKILLLHRHYIIQAAYTI